MSDLELYERIAAQFGKSDDKYERKIAADAAKIADMLRAGAEPEPAPLTRTDPPAVIRAYRAEE